MKINIFRISLLLILLHSISSFSQIVEKNDSLKKLLLTETNLRKKGEIMAQLGDNYSHLNKDSAYMYLEAAYQIAIVEKDILFQSRVAAMLGMTYLNEDRVKSTEYTFKALELAEQSKDSNQIAYTYNIVGSHYRVTGELDKAISFYTKSLAIRKSQNDTMSIAVCYNNLGIAYMMKAVYDTGLYYWKNSLELKLAVGEEMSAAKTMANIAIYYKDIGRIFEALEYTSRALEIELKNNDYLGACHGYTLLGEIYSKTENYPKAIAAFNLSLAMADSVNSEFEKIEPVYGLSKAHKNNGNYKESLANLEYYCELYKKFNDENAARISKETQTKFETDEKEKENLLLKTKNETQDLKLKEEAARTELQEANNRYLWIGLGLIFMVLIIIILTLRRVRLAKLQIEIQKHLVDEKNREITDSINYAKRIQAAILPPQRIVKQYLPESFILYIPKDIVAGDFYWLESYAKASDSERNETQTILFAAADCTGHGVPGAMVSVICNNGLNRAVREYGLLDPGKILDRTREIVISEFEKSDDEVQDGMDISLCSISPLSFGEGPGVRSGVRLEWAGANNPLWIFRTKNGTTTFEEIKADKQPIGKFSGAKQFTTKNVDLEKGDLVYIFTDGFQDQFGGEKGKKFKAASLRKLLMLNIHKSMDEQRDLLEKAFMDWKGKLEQIDDVCIIGVRV